MSSTSWNAATGVQDAFNNNNNNNNNKDIYIQRKLEQ